MTLAHLPTNVAVDQEAVLRAVGLDVHNPNSQALLLICERYGLDPLLKHVVLIQQRPYITRDGYLHIAHVSGHLDGIEVIEQGDEGSHWVAKVAVFRKDMSRPFVYVGRYPKNGGNKAYGPEMAVKTAEVMALRRAFNVTGAGAADERWDDNEPEHLPPSDVPLASEAEIAELVGMLDAITDEPTRKALKREFVEEFGHPSTLEAARVEDARLWIVHAREDTEPVVGELVGPTDADMAPFEEGDPS